MRLRAICVCIQPDAGSDALADALTDPCADALIDACADAEVRGSISGDASSWHKAHWRVRAICVCIQPDAGSDTIAHALSDAGADPSSHGLAYRHHRRKPRLGRGGVADRPEHGTDDLRSDRRLEHRSGDEHGESVLRTNDIQRRHQQVEYSKCFEHGPGMRPSVIKTCLYYL